MNKKIFLSLLLVLVVALSVSAVAADSVDDAVISDSIDDNIVASDVTEEPAYTSVEDDVAAINDAIAHPVDNVVTLEEREYDIGQNVITVDAADLTIQGKGINKTIIKIDPTNQEKNGGAFILNGANIILKDISFVYPDGETTAYGVDSYGSAVKVNRPAADATIDSCSFAWFNKGVFVAQATNTVIKNSYFTGTTKHVEVGGKESGAYGIGGQGCIDIKVLNNTFEGQLIDGVSIYGSSSGGQFINNTFKDGVYAIFYGGASTAGGVIEGNKFINCGVVTNNGEVIMTGIPIISAAKSADGFRVTNNTFELASDSLCMILEDGNTAHGAPTNIGDINITDNTVTMIEGASASSVTFVKIVSRAQYVEKNGTITIYTGELIPKAPIVIANNTLPDEATAVYYWNEVWGTPGDTIIPKGGPITTMIQIAELNTASKKITVKLSDVNGNELAGKTITYSINGADPQTATTDEDGLATVSVEDGLITFNFAEDDDYAASSNEVNFKASNEQVASAITAADMTATAKISKTLAVTLKDAAGNILANKVVTYSVNGVTKTAKTDSKGVAKITVNQVAGTYYYALTFLGDDGHKAAFKTVKVTVNKQAVKATFAKATLKAKVAKKVKFTLKDASGKAIAGKKITVKVNGKTFSAKTNSKGIAYIKVKVTKKGKFTATAKFAGDNVYKAITKKATFTVK